MKTKLTELLGIKYPIIQGPMAWITEAKLAAAVGEAGGVGIIGSGGRQADWLRNEIKAVRNATDKIFGVNIVLMDKNKDDLLKVTIEEKVPVVTLGAGNPVPYIRMLKEAGIKVICIVPNLKLAKRVEDNDADAIVIEGMEAGGHIGTLTTMALMTQIIPEMKIPVIAAGGFADGRGMASALLMGAAGIQVGTAFLLAEECQVHGNFKEKLLQAQDTDTVVTAYGRSHATRGLKNAFTEEYLRLERQGSAEEELDRLAAGSNFKAAVKGDVENGSVQAGQCLSILKEIRPAKAIIDDFIQVATDVLRNAPSLVE